MSVVGSHEVFEILTREHAPMLAAYLRGVVRDPAAADDLFQETMVVAWRTLDRFDRTRPFAPWLRGIAKHVVLAHRRKAARGEVLCDEATLDQFDRRFEEWRERPGDTLDEQLDGLRDCLDALHEPFGEAVRLRYRDELETPELAKRLNVSIEALKKRLQRGRAKLQECLERKRILADSPT